MTATVDNAVADLQRANAELQRRLDEALARERAMAEVLAIINSSPGDLMPVFQTIVEKAHALCDAGYGSLQLWDGERFRGVAMRGFTEAMMTGLRAGYSPVTMPCQRLVEGESIAHCVDLAEIDSPIAREGGVRLAGIRTILYVALRKDGVLLGQIVAARKEVRPFTDKEIALVESFAAQAVIAMENARLITETQEALDQQTATAEVLQVINSSPGNLTPVFEAILNKAHTLCGATRGSLFLFDGETFRAAFTQGYPEDFANMLRQGISASQGAFATLVAGARLVHIPDLTQIGDPVSRAVAERGGVRTNLLLPLRKDDTLLGVISCNRGEVRPFSDSEIALLQNFAAQAVIAMENARLLGELRERTGDLEESLEYQTATSDVLKVISRSTFDLQPVLNTLVATAARLCDADMAMIFRRDGENHRLAANFGFPPQFEAFVRNIGGAVPGRRSITGRTAIERRIVHIADVASDPEFNVPEAIALGKMRTALGVPLLREGEREPIGVIALSRQRVEPFTERQIELVRTFADQAVIAIENVRLFNELNERTGDLEESLEYQTATSDVLKVISRSPVDLSAVLDFVCQTAARLCQVELGSIFRLEDGVYRWATGFGLEPAYRAIEEQAVIAPGIGTLVGRVAIEGKTVHILDGLTDPLYEAKDELRVAKCHTMLGVPLLRDGVAIGVICLARQSVEAFSDKQIELVTTFADQAVIAIENVRLFDELRDRTRDLQESLEYQTATSDLLKVISRSTFDLEPVLQIVAETATRLCRAEMGLIQRHDGEVFRAVAAVGFAPEFIAFLDAHPITGGRGNLTGRVAQEGRTIQIIDTAIDPEYTFTESIRLGKIRTQLGVPLLREGSLIGTINLCRQRVEPFTDKEIDLVTTFADQAVIAIENARLLTEQREALEQQTATAEVLQVINSSPGDLAPVFDAMLDKATRLSEAAFGILWTYDGERFQAVAFHNVPPAYMEFLREPQLASPVAPLGRVARGEAFAHVPDLAAEEYHERAGLLVRQGLSLGGFRTVLAVPMRKDALLLGAITIYRREVQPFSDKQIALLQSFATQAVIAMENARLLDEIRQRQAELRVTFDNMADGVAMFDEARHLAAWNRNFQELLDLPDAFLAEPRSYADFIRYLAERGEFGEVDPEAELRRYSERIGRQSTIERIRPDARVIEVRHNPMPDGGFVLIYGEITERKAAEEQIRAARDAAEEASRTIEAAYSELKAAQSSLIQAQKMAALGQLTAGIAHEIKNPLNFVNNFAGLSVELLDELKQSTAPAIGALNDDKRAEIDETIGMLTSNLEKISEHGRRADNIVKSMLEHSRGVSGERREVDLNNLIDEALNLAYHGARAQDGSFNIGLQHDYAPMLKPIELVPQEMTRVFLNLFGNGFYAAHQRAQQTVDAAFQPLLSVATRDLGEAVEIRIRDNGTGISADIRDKLFQPFFTTKPTGEGTGLGLSISYDIVTQQHGGTIEVDSQVGEFTQFTIRLPRQ